MAIKLADTLAPMADFPAAMAEHIEFDDGKSLQEKYDLGELGGEGGGGHIELTQAEYDALSEDEKLNGATYFITDAIGGGDGAGIDDNSISTETTWSSAKIFTEMSDNYAIFEGVIGSSYYSTTIDDEDIANIPVTDLYGGWTLDKVTTNFTDGSVISAFYNATKKKIVALTEDARIGEVYDSSFSVIDDTMNNGGKPYKVALLWSNKDGNGKGIDKNEVLTTYVSIGDLNTRKGLSISLVANEDNTQQIIDALESREQFIEWFGNSNDRFGINPKTYGSRINEIRITKMTTDATVTAIMDSGAVLSRVYTGGVLGDWSSTGHKLIDGYMDDGTICITGENEDSSGMYGNGVLPETLGFTRDAMTWANGLYRISHGIDLVGLPENLQAGRLEHFNLKRWHNANPYVDTWADRMSIFYSVNGNIYTRVQTSGATAGVITSDTGWRCVTQNTKGLRSNSQYFKIDITKGSESWNGIAKLSFNNETTPTEVTFTITTNKVYYTITEGVNCIKSVTCTFNSANVVIGVELNGVVYGTQMVEMNSTFGTINSLTAETFAGTTSAILKGYDGKSYTSLMELGLTSDATIQDVIDALPIGGNAIIRTDSFTNWSTLFNGIQWGYLKVEKTVNGLSNIELQEVVAPNRKYFGTQASGKFASWVQMNTEEILHTSLSGNLAGITTVLDLVNALLTEYRALNPKKPIRFVSGEITKTTLTDLPVSYGILQITVAGWDIVEVRLAHSANGFKSIYYGFLNRISGQESIGSLTWRLVEVPITELTDLGLDGSATIQNVMDAMLIGQHCIINTTRFDDKTQVGNIEYGKVEIRRLSSAMWSLWLEDVLHADVVAHGTCSGGKFAGWHYFATAGGDEYFNGSLVYTTEIDLSKSDFQYKGTGIGYVNLGIFNSARIISIEGWYTPPSGTSYSNTMINSASSEVGRIVHKDGDWKISVAGSSSQSGSGYLRIRHLY